MHSNNAHAANFVFIVAPPSERGEYERLRMVLGIVKTTGSKVRALVAGPVFLVLSTTGHIGFRGDILTQPLNRSNTV
jgi:hypothetical protein